MRRELVSGVIGAGIGYSMSSILESNHPPQDDREMILLRTQVETLQRINDLLKHESESSKDLIANLESQLAKINSQLHSIDRSDANREVVSVGVGNLDRMNWIQGRDGLVVSKYTPNFIPNDFHIDTVVGFNRHPIRTGRSVSNVLLSASPVPMTLGVASNTSLNVTMSKGMFPSMSVILSFNENVGHDTDFVVGSTIHNAGGAYRAYSICTPVGEKALMLSVLAPVGVAVNWSANNWMSNVINDFSQYGVPCPPNINKEQKQSYMPYGIGIVFTLTHRSIRTLTLRSWNVVAHPLARWMQSITDSVDPTQLKMIKRMGDATVVDRINTGSGPLFYRVDENSRYVRAELPLNTFM